MSLSVCMQREEEKQRQLKRQQELLKVARQHYHRNLLLRRGLAPWKHLIQLSKTNTQVRHLSRPFQLSAATAYRVFSAKFSLPSVLQLQLFKNPGGGLDDSGLTFEERNKNTI